MSDCAAPVRSEPSKRVAALAEYGILDTPIEPAFEAITQIASIALEAPVAVVNLIEDERQWFKSEVGLGTREVPIDVSICVHALLQNDFLEIEDLRADRRTCANPLVLDDTGFRFYAGALLRTAENIAIGTVCVLDRRPRSLAESQRAILRSLAVQAMALLEARRALRRASQYQRGQAHFMATVGHDLRQPLQRISSSVEMALARSSGSPAAAKHLKNALHAVVDMGKELDALAQEAASHPGTMAEVVLVRFALDELIEALAPTWRDLAAAKGLSFQIECQGAALVRSDRRLLSSILSNLVGNSLKYTRAGRVKVGYTAHPDGWLEVFVVDTGIGMSVADQSKIFAPFQQVDASSEGMGLGLALVKQAADFLKLKISVTSVKDLGSRFSFLIPVDRQA